MAIDLDTHWDLTVNDRQGQLVLAVEVTRKTNVSSEWATQFRRNILAHGTLPTSPYFLMALPEKFYLWVKPETDQSKPTYEIDAAPILQPYLERTGRTVDSISRSSLELVVLAWLGTLLYAGQPSAEIALSQPWLVESGLYAAITGGKFGQEAAA